MAEKATPSTVLAIEKSKASGQVTCKDGVEVPDQSRGALAIATRQRILRRIR